MLTELILDFKFVLIAPIIAYLLQHLVKGRQIRVHHTLLVEAPPRPERRYKDYIKAGPLIDLLDALEERADCI